MPCLACRTATEEAGFVTLPQNNGVLPDQTLSHPPSTCLWFIEADSSPQHRDTGLLVTVVLSLAVHLRVQRCWHRGPITESLNR